MKKESGFTLVEAMIVIGIISILAALSIPAIMSWMPNYRLKAATRDIYSNMQKAKIEAAKRKDDVLIQFSTGAYNPSGRVGWYRVFVDNDTSGAFTAGDTILINRINMPANVSLIASTFGNDIAGFNPRSLPVGNWGAVQLQNNNSRFYQITMSAAGSMRIQTSNNGVNWN